MTVRTYSAGSLPARLLAGQAPDGSYVVLQVDANGGLALGAVTLSSEIEIKNDAGNPVPMAAVQLPASLGVKTAANSLSMTIASDQANVLVSSSSVLVAGTVNGGAFTRPADTTAYAAKDVVSDSTSTPHVITFAGMGRVNGGSGTIVKARLMTSQKTNTASYRLHLFHTAPTATNDNSPYLYLYANAANRVGMIDFPAFNTEDPTNSTAAGSMRPSSDGSYGPPNLWYKCAANDTSLYGVLETLTAFTPDSAQTFYPELGAELN